MEQIQSGRLWLQSNVLSKIAPYNWVKDSFGGAHERDVLRVVDKWSKAQNYKPNEEEKALIRKQRLITQGFICVGIGLPSMLLISPLIRSMCIGSKVKNTCFGLSVWAMAYSNYITSKTHHVYNLLELDDSPLAYACFQVMCQPQYKRFRNKWQNQYNLSKVANRYKNFNLHEAMNKTSLNVTFE